MIKLPDIVQALLKPEAYPEVTKNVELEQTQMSFVFLTDNYAYKVKKPVNLGYLDYTTFNKRKFYCHKEVKLNQRLCSDIYLGVVPIIQGQGTFFIDKKGKAVECAVKMRRLPRELTMDVLLEKNRVSTEMINRLAEKLVSFHQNMFS